MHQQKHGTGNTTLEELRHLPEETLLVEEPIVLASWLCPEECPFSRSVYRRAEEYVRDYELAKYAHELNLIRGIAIPSAAVIEHSFVLKRRVITQSAIGQLNADSPSAIKRWAWRWRRRIDGKIGFFNTREHFDKETMRKKARYEIHVIRY